jgi:hypothetical protein
MAVNRRTFESIVLAEACVSRTHRRHRRCRPPVLKTGTITGPHALPFGFNCLTYPRRSASRSSWGGTTPRFSDSPGFTSNGFEVVVRAGHASNPPCLQAQFLKKSACLAMGAVRPVRPAICVWLSGVKARASCTFSSSWAIESHPTMTVLTGKLRVK